MVQFILLLRAKFKYPKLSFYLVITITSSRSRTNLKHARIITQCNDLKTSISLKVLKLKHRYKMWANTCACI